MLTYINIVLASGLIGSYFITYFIEITMPVYMILLVLIFGNMVYPAITLLVLVCLILIFRKGFNVKYHSLFFMGLFLLNLLWFVIKWDIKTMKDIGQVLLLSIFYILSFFVVKKVKYTNSYNQNFFLSCLIVYALFFFSFWHDGNL